MVIEADETLDGGNGPGSYDSEPTPDTTAKGKAARKLKSSLLQVEFHDGD